MSAGTSSAAQARQVLDLFRKSLVAVSPRLAVKKTLKVEGNKLIVNKCEYPLNENIRIVALGKAGVEMVRGAEESLGKHVRDGIALVPSVPSDSTEWKTRFYEGAEGNLPDERAVENTNEVLKFLGAESSNKYDLIVLFLISGGGSALLCAPIEGVYLNEKLQVTRLLASNGADINDLNAVRKVLSKVKGGKLVDEVGPSKAIALIVSDIVGGRIENVSSGPTVPQDCSPTKAIEVLNRFELWDKIPDGVRAALKANSQPKVLSSVNIKNVLICDNRVLLAQFKNCLESNGIHTSIVTAELVGNAREVGERLAVPLLNWIDGLDPRAPFAPSDTKIEIPGSGSFAWVYGGETTVRFPAECPSPKGGRNQEMALAVLRALRNHFAGTRRQLGHSFVFFSIGSDGQDGPTDAAGAWVVSENENYEQLTADEITRHLDNKTSYDFWSKFQSGTQHTKLGKTGMNLMDCQLLLFLRS